MAKKSKKPVGATLTKDGAHFRLWAPFAASVSVAGSWDGWQKKPMSSGDDGYWDADIDNAAAGAEYKFFITTPDGRELCKNDPRALQLTANNGNSVLVHKPFDWSGDSFVPPPMNEQVIYELHVGTFSRLDPSTPGNFHEAMRKLDHLSDLGINMIELMPIASMPDNHQWGYVVDFIYAVDGLYGGRHAFLEFVKAAHQKGIGVILDVVYNHFGPNVGLDLWQFDGWSQDGKGGIYFYNDWRASTPWGETRPDYGRPEVQDYILENVRQWIAECHLDGLRVDSTGFIRTVYGRNNDPSNDIPDGWYLMQRINELVSRINPRAVMIAEDFSGNEYITKPVGEGGAGFSSQWEVRFPHALRDALDTNEDQSRNLSVVAGIFADHYNGDVFQRVIYGDSHDTAANGGARLSEEISPGNPSSIFARRRSLLGSALVLTAPGIPMLFQGEEFVEGGSFNDWRALDWQKAEKFAGIVQAHRDLIALRKNIAGKTRGLTGQNINILHLNDADKVLAYHRWEMGGEGDDVVVAANFSNKVLNDYQLQFPRDGVWKTRFNSDYKGYSADFKNTATPDVQIKDGNGSVNLGPYSVVVLSQD